MREIERGKKEKEYTEHYQIK